MVKYKQRCMLCRKNMALITSYYQKPICMPCQMKDFDKPIEDPKFRKLFDIDAKLYMENSFLRDIKSKYIRFGSLTENQIKAFARVAKELNPKKSDSIGVKTDNVTPSKTKSPTKEKKKKK